MRLLIEMTPPTPTPLRKPRTPDLRYFRGPFPESFLPLLPSGAEYVTLGAQFPVAPDQRYGLRLRIVSAEEITSHGAMRGLVKE